ncbi:MAG: AAA family ATPase [Candidatus Atribacteria bacterium]|nr:AAA family ATPase [Candidatus Atribacteria bacterium]
MKIRSIYCDGFGILSQQGIDNIPKGLIVIIGNNESGKTTFMDFLRTSLFGFSSQRNQRKGYLPIGNSKHGGRLIVVMKDGREFYIEWNHSKWIIKDKYENNIDHSIFRNSLGNIDRETYKRIFAIGLQDLQGLEILSEENIKSRLFSAGAGLGATSFPGLIKKIDRELDNLLTKKGRNPIINQTLYKLNEINSKIKSFQEQTSLYIEIQKKLETIEENIKRNRQKEITIRDRLQFINKLEQVQSFWIRFKEAKQNEEKFRFAQVFPEQGIKRLEKIKHEIEGLEINKNNVNQAIENMKNEIEKSLGFENIIQHQDEIELCIGEKEKYLSFLEEHSRLKKQNLLLKNELLQKLSDLGPEWTRDKLRKTQVTLEIKKSVEMYKKSFIKINEKIQFLQNELNTKTELGKSLTHQIHLIDKKLFRSTIPFFLSSDDLQIKKQALKKLRSLFQELDKNQFFTAQLKKKDEEQKNRYEEQLKKPQEILKPLPLWLKLIISFLPFIFSYFISSYNNQLIPKEWLFFLSISGSVMIFITFYHHHRKQLNLRKRFFSELKKFEDEIDQLHEEIYKLQKQSLLINRQIDEMSQKYFPKKFLSISELERFETQFEKEIEDFLQHQELKKEQNNLILKQREIQQMINDLQQHLNETEKEKKQMRENWLSWLIDNGFPTTTLPEDFQIILQFIENAQNEERHLCNEEDRENQHYNYLEKTRSSLLSLLQLCGEAPTNNQLDISYFERLHAYYTNAIERQRKYLLLKDQLEQKRLEEKIIEEQLKLKRMELSDLYNLIKVKDEENYRLFADAHEKWFTAQKEITEANESLQLIAGNPEKLNSLIKELQETHISQLQEEKISLENELNDLIQKIGQDEQEKGAIIERMTYLENNQTLGELLFEERFHREKLHNDLKRWATFVLARHFLKQTQNSYEQNRQPRVIQEAQQFIQQITNHRYRLFSSIDSQTIYLEEQNHRRKKENEWSSGLADQVYLSIRFGLALEFGRMNEPLPLLLDDILVNFDPSRQVATAKIILQLSEENQIFLFSCHPETSKIIQKASTLHHLEHLPVTFYQIKDGIITLDSDELLKREL